MPEIHSNSRFNSENKFGDTLVNPRKAKKKTATKGCPRNDNSAHLYGAIKTIGIHTVENCRDFVRYNVSCIFCGKKRLTRKYGQAPNFEIYETQVIHLGARAAKFGSYIVKRRATFSGNTDEKGREIQ